MKIGIVTASTGAAVHDIIRVSKTRNPYVQLILYPAQVQGEGAAATIVAGINCLDSMGLDVIIVGRGGGSIEDLWAFNEEIVAKAIFHANTPIISAVGHETDFTIADFVADKRAATPSQAAELANFVYDDFAGRIDRYSDKLNRALDYKLLNAAQLVENYKLRLNALRPENKLKANETQLKLYFKQLQSLIENKLSRYENRLISVSARLDGLSPAKKLATGFGYVTNEAGKRIDSAADLAIGESMVVRIKDGTIRSQVTDIDFTK